MRTHWYETAAAMDSRKDAARERHRKPARICDAISQIKPGPAVRHRNAAFWAVIPGDIRYEDARRRIS